MSATLFFEPTARPLNISGLIMPGAVLTFYLTQSTTLAGIFADAALSTPLLNPLDADTDGRFPAIYLDPTITYRVLLEDAQGVEQYDIDPYLPPYDAPPGTVVMWFGAADELEDHYPNALWQVCDGTNLSPDMRDRFPLGQGGTYDVGDTGGADTDNATTADESAHTHTAPAAGAASLTVAQLPEVTLSLRGSYTAGGYDGGSNQFYRARSSDAYVASEDLVQKFGDGDMHTHPSGGATGGGSAHHHDVTVDIIPPFLALYFLMRRYP